MSSWMHFIGKSYYDIDTFIAEAKKFGITRRLPLSLAKGMSWGDIVTCVQKEGSNKSHSVFMEFPITRIAGLPEGTSAKLGKILPMRQLDVEPEEISRECGEYETTGTFEVDAPLSDLAMTLDGMKKEGEDVGKLMIGCGPEDIILVPKPYPKVNLNSPQKMGFYSYNRDKFVGDVEAAEEAGRNVLLKGTYYLKREPDMAAPGAVVEIRGYGKREDIDEDFKAGALHVKRKRRRKESPTDPQLALI